jgi:hypothetical protein
MAASMRDVRQIELLHKAFVDGERLYRVVLEFISEVGIALFSAWLYDAIKKYRGKKTEIESRPVPENVVQIEILIKQIIEGSESDQPDKQKPE